MPIGLAAQWAQTRFGDVLVSHWPVYGAVAAIAVGVAVLAWFFRHSTTDSDDVAGKTIAGWATLLVAPPLIYITGFASGLSTQASIFAALLAATVIMWVFTLVDEFVPPLMALVATLFIGLAPPDIALAAFSSPSMLLLVGVFALSAVISASGLSYRVMLRLVLFLPDKPIYRRLMLLVSGYVLSPVVPSTSARMSLLMAVFKEMASSLRLPPRGPAITGLLAATFGGAILFGPMMATGKSSNIAALNMLPTQVRVEFSGLFWLCAAAAAAILITATHLFLLPRVFPSEQESPLPREQIQQKLADMGRLTLAEYVVTGSVLFFLIGSATEPWHHVKAPYLAGCVLLALLVTKTLRRREFQSLVDWPMIFFLLGIDSLTRVMNYLGLSQALARATRHAFDFIDGKAALFILATLAVTLTVRLVLPVSAGMLTSMVILLPVATTQGIHPWVCLFCVAMFSDIAIFRHQGTNGIVQIRAADIFEEADERSFLRYNMFMNIARIAAVFASIPWWTWLGLL